MASYNTSGITSYTDTSSIAGISAASGQNYGSSSSGLMSSSSSRGRNRDADMYAGSKYAPTSNAGTAKAKQSFAATATSSDDDNNYTPSALAPKFEAAGATLPTAKDPRDRFRNTMASSLYDSDIFKPYVPDPTEEIESYLANTAVEDALKEALGIDDTERQIYQGIPTQEEPEPNIDMSVLQGALQPEPITVEELPDVITKAGDTLTSIAEANGVPVQDVIDANPQIKNPDMIRPGQKVTLPTNKPLTQQEMLDVNTPLGDTKVVAANVDFDFIKAREGYEKKMYVPKSKGKVLGKSGPTIASGFDLGQRNEADLAGLPPALVDKLKPYLGKKGVAADAYVKSNPLTLTTKEADQINKFAKKQEVDRLKDDWESASDVDFEDLTKEQATVVASVAFQYGDLPTKAPTFWRHVTNGAWDKAEAELRSFGDKYTTRRVAEADYLAGN
jgi:LysM repeat protein/GH24 family phage-related lysozyme (muramidase)